MKVYPIMEVQEQLLRYMAEHRNVHFNQQFNCAKCGAKQTMEQRDRLFTSGKCEECGHVTDIQNDGCNYMLAIGVCGPLT